MVGMAMQNPARWVGEQLGRYRIVQHLGSGGVAHVFLAEEPATRAGTPPPRVALKLLRVEYMDRHEIVQRFHREAEAAARIRSHHVLRVGRVEQAPGVGSYFSCELLVGLDLADTLTYAGGRLEPPRAVRIGAAVTEGLAAAHRVGVIHRDLKPENVFLVHAADGREVVKVLDFGFAWVEGDAPVEERPRITSSLRPVGTPEYMSPEQTGGCVGRPTDDVYSFGILLFEMLSGAVPFEGRSFAEIAHRHAEAPIPSLASRGIDVSAALDAVVYRCLAKLPEDRWPTMEALRDALAATPEARG
jgi:eukaryotic-like serine/threonine-protein kinase